MIASVAADFHGFVFNCDGQYALDTSSGTVQKGCLNGAQCIYANYTDAANNNYAAHTQLARVNTPATGGDPQQSTSTNATFEPLETTDTAVVPVTALSDLAGYFAGGPGAVHIYGLNTPYTLYPVEG